MSHEVPAVAAPAAAGAAEVLDAAAALAAAVVPPVEAKKKFGGKRKAKGTPKVVKDPSAPVAKRTAPKKSNRPSAGKPSKSSILTVPKPVLNRILKTVPYCENMRLASDHGAAIVNRMMNRNKAVIVAAHKSMEARNAAMITLADIAKGGKEVYPHSVVYQPNNTVLVPLPPAIKAH